MNLDYIDNKDFMKVAVEWAYENLKDYIEHHYGKNNYIHTVESSISVFVEDCMLDDYDDRLGELDTMYLIEKILIDKYSLKEKDLTGEEIGWFSEDFINFEQIGIYPISEMSKDFFKK